MMIPSDPGTPGAVGEATYLDDDVVGIMVNGVLLDAHKQTWSYDICNGHSDRKHQYHYHIPPICFLESMGVAFADGHTWWIDNKEVRAFEKMKDLFPVQASPSPVIGYARDGFPIYGPYDNTGNRMSSALYGGNLDECNGKLDANGNYGYFLTVDPPFAPPCLRGNVGSFTYATSDKACPREGIVNTVVVTDTDPAVVEDDKESSAFINSIPFVVATLALVFMV